MALRLVACDRGSPPRPHERELAVELAGNLPHAIGLHASRREFDRQGEPVELAADLTDPGRVLIGQGKSVLDGGDAIEEQLNSRVRQGLLSRSTRVDGRIAQREQPMDVFAFGPERLAARGQQVNLRRLSADVFRDGGGGLDVRFTAIEDQKHPSLAKEGDDSGEGPGPLHGNSQRRGQAADEQRRVEHAADVEETDIPLEF